MTGRFAIHMGDGSLQILELFGRVEDTLCKLIDAGPDGVTSLENPAPRLSDYVFKLRRRGVAIETLTEPHGGDFPGFHGRYVLRSKVERLEGGIQTSSEVLDSLSALSEVHRIDLERKSPGRRISPPEGGTP